MQNISKAINLEVHTTNEFNRVALLEIAHLLPLLKKFVGKKIFTINGRAKIFVIDFLNSTPIPFNGGNAKVYRCYLDNEYNKLHLNFTVLFTGNETNSYTKYVERRIELGKVDSDGKLIDLTTFETVLTDYRLDKVLDIKQEIAAIEEYAKFKALAEAAKSKINVSSDIYRYV